MNNAEEIALKLGVSRVSVYIYARENKIKPVQKIVCTNYYDLNDFKDLLIRKYRKTTQFKKRIHIIEYWVMMRLFKSTEEIANELDISERSLILTINEYKRNDNCVIIKSKL